MTIRIIETFCGTNYVYDDKEGRIKCNDLSSVSLTRQQNILVKSLVDAGGKDVSTQNLVVSCDLTGDEALRQLVFFARVTIPSPVRRGVGKHDLITKGRDKGTYRIDGRRIL